MNLSEAQTRMEIVDRALATAGWDVNDPAKVVLEFRIESPSALIAQEGASAGVQYSDYVLLGRDGKPLAVVEAKKTAKDAALGREQAKQYCYGIRDQRECELLFCFYTNGDEIFFWDLENYPSRNVVGFPTREDLERLQYVRRNCKAITHEFINTEIAGRDYQILDILDHNTFKLFHCKDSLPTFSYIYEGAVGNTPPYLCNFQVMKIQTKFQMDGISKRTISLEALYGKAFAGKLDLSRVPSQGTVP